MDAGAVKYQWKMFSGDLEEESIYRGPPTYQREKAWEALESRKNHIANTFKMLDKVTGTQEAQLIFQPKSWLV